MTGPRHDPRSRRRWSRLSVPLVTAAIGVGGVWFATAFVARERAAVVSGWRARLWAAADDRRRAVERWVEERQGDLHVVTSFPTTRSLVASRGGPPRSPHVERPDAHLSEVLDHVARAHGYRGVWVVRGDVTIARDPGARDLAPDDLEQARRLADGRDALGGWKQTPTGPTVLMATWVDAVPPGPRRAGLVVLEADLQRSLSPVLVPPPFASETAESFLVARQGRDIVVLGPARRVDPTPLELRRSSDTPGRAAREALLGAARFGEFVDDRGVRVLAASRLIRNRPWGLVVKVDRDEALAELGAEMRVVGVAVGFAVVALVGIAIAVRRAERYRAQVELTRTRARFATLLDQAEDVILFVGADGRLLDANRRAEQVYGYTREELRAMRARDLRPPEARAEVDARVAQTLREGSARFEAIHQHKDGTRFPVEVNARLVDAGDLRGIVAIVRDMSAWKQQQAALEESRAKLAETERQLLQAQKLEAVGRLAAGVAHDFNNLLTVIAGYARLVADALPRNDPKRDEVNQIVEAADRAASLTRQLLAFGRRQVLQPRVLDLNAVVSGVAEMLERLLGDDVRLVVRASPTLGRVEVDEGQVQQVLMNLAVNARDAMPEGGTLTIATRDLVVTETNRPAYTPVPPGAYVVVDVSDTGTGMDADTCARIFEPFFTTKPAGQGTGLGLSTVYGIVKQSGGYIGVASEPGRGTCFTLYFPRVEAVQAPAPGAPPAPSPRARGGETVLVVEDQPTVRQLVRRVLEDHGYRVWVAANGREGLEAIERAGSAIHVLVTDLVMPELSGLELWRHARTLQPDLRVVFTSGYSHEAREAGRLPEASRFLPKPFTPEDLLRELEAALGRPIQPD